MNVQLVALRSHNLNLRIFIAVSLLALVLMAPSPARAAALTDEQVQAVLKLLGSFGADQSVISNTESVLRGTPAPTASTQSLISPFLSIFSNSSGKGSAPHVELRVKPSRVEVGDAFNLRWKSDKMSSCTVSSEEYSATGVKGSKNIRANVEGGYVFTLSCTGDDGAAYTASAPLSVVADGQAASSDDDEDDDNDDDEDRDDNDDDEDEDKHNEDKDDKDDKSNSRSGRNSSVVPPDSLIGSLGFLPESLWETTADLGVFALNATADSLHTLAAIIEDLNGALANLAGAYSAFLVPAEAVSAGQNVVVDVDVFPRRLMAGDTLNLAWSSQGVDDCVVASGDYSASGVSDSKRLRAMMPGKYVFDLSCTEPDGAEHSARVAVTVLSEEMAAAYTVDSEAILTIAHLPGSLYETMAAATDYMAAVEMAPVYVLVDGLSDAIYEAGLY